MMESSCLRHTEIPHTSALFSDFQYHFDKVARFYPHNPHDARAYTSAAKQLAYPDDRRASLVAALRAGNDETASLDLLARPGTVAEIEDIGLPRPRSEEMEESPEFLEHVSRIRRVLRATSEV